MKKRLLSLLVSMTMIVGIISPANVVFAGTEDEELILIEEEPEELVYTEDAEDEDLTAVDEVVDGQRSEDIEITPDGGEAVEDKDKLAVKKVTYSNGTGNKASCSVTIKYKGIGFKDLDTKIGSGKGKDDKDFDTYYPDNPSLKLTDHRDGTYTLESNPIRFTTSAGVKPAVGAKIWVGVQVYDEENGLLYSQLEVTVPKEGESVTVEDENKDPIEIPIPAAQNCTFDGKEHTGVAENAGYTISGQNKATEAGDYTVNLKLKQGYKWTGGSTSDQTIKWFISKFHLNKSATKIKWKNSKVKFKYNGKVQLPTVTSIIANGVKVPKSDYTVTAPESVNEGQYSLKISVKSSSKNFTGSTTQKYQITDKYKAKYSKPAKVKLESYKEKVKGKYQYGIKAKFPIAAGYEKKFKSGDRPVKFEMQVSTDKNFVKGDKNSKKGANGLFEENGAKASKVFIKTYKYDIKKKSATIKGLKPKTKYYVRVRVINEKKKTKWVSGWSKTANVTTKK